MNYIILAEFVAGRITVMGTTNVIHCMLVSWSLPLMMGAITRLWYAAPLIVSVSLVYAATRHEEMLPILNHAVRFAVWILVFMAVVVAVLAGLDWLV